MQSSFDDSLVLVRLFIDSATRYGQLSTGVLMLSVTFLEKIGGQSTQIRPGGLLIAAWSFLLVSIGSGAAYNYFAIKYLESRAGTAGGYPSIFTPLVHSPGFLYGAMLITFLIGAILLTGAAIRRLPHSATRAPAP